MVVRIQARGGHGQLPCGALWSHRHSSRLWKNHEKVFRQPRPWHSAEAGECKFLRMFSIIAGRESRLSPGAAADRKAGGSPPPCRVELEPLTYSARGEARQKPEPATSSGGGPSRH